MRKRKYHVTKEGLEQKKEELKEITIKLHKDIPKRLKEIVGETSDIRENIGYLNLLTEKEALEQKARELQDIIENAVIVSPKESEKISFGHFVTVKEMRSKKIYTFQLVGSAEVNLDETKGPLRISRHCPLGKAIINKKVGEIVNVYAPAGPLRYKILSIST